MTRKEARDYQRQYRKDNPTFVKSMNLRKYGLSYDEWVTLVDQCDNKCEACGQEEIGENQYGRISLAIDHDHASGTIRGLLCHRCNRAMGLLQDSVERLQQLITYRSK